MIEPIVQDYINMALTMDKDSFCQQVTGYVLVTVTRQFEPSFQTAPTRMLSDDERLSPTKKPRIDHKAKVLDLRPQKPNRLGQVTIGRSEENDIVLTDETVSSHHAIFMPSPKTGQPTLQDYDSTNGTRINENPIIPGRSALLHDGDLVSFGDMMFLFYSSSGFFKTLNSMTDS